MRAVALTLALAAAATGCTRTRFTSDVNAPGKVTLAPPPREDGSPGLYVEPDDPGEHEVYFAPGVVIGPASGRRPDASDAGIELGMYLRMAYNTHARSHRKDDVPLPIHGWALQAGWSPLQTGADVDIGPVFVELEKVFFVTAIGFGVAVYPDDGNAGLQLTLAARPYGLRFRYMAETGFELIGAFQLELPSAYSWSR